MRPRASVLIAAGVLVAGFVVFLVPPNRPTGILIAAELLALGMMTIGGAALSIQSWRHLRDWLLGRRTELFAPDRCHHCGYDTSRLVKGVTARPECGTILASIPRLQRAAEAR